jgi:hypothetical protein
VLVSDVATGKVDMDENDEDDDDDDVVVRSGKEGTRLVKQLMQGTSLHDFNNGWNQ